MELMSPHLINDFGVSDAIDEISVGGGGASQTLDPHNFMKIRENTMG